MMWPRSSERSMSLWIICCGIPTLSFPGQHRTVACLCGHKMQWDDTNRATTVLFDHDVHGVLMGIPRDLVILVDEHDNIRIHLNTVVNNDVIGDKVVKTFHRQIVDLFYP